MSRIIKFPLKLKDDFPVRSLEELRQHFDLCKIIGYFIDGRLLTWLQSRSYNAQADIVKTLNKNDTLLATKLCQIFKIDYDEDVKLNMSSIEEKNNRLSVLRQYTSDKEILNQVEKIAFNQDDLNFLINEGKVNDIYLCNNSFVIPFNVKNKQNKHYTGIGKVIAFINSHQIIDFTSLNILFTNIHFDKDYTTLLEDPDYQAALKARRESDYSTAVSYFQKAADKGIADAFNRLGFFYYNGLGVTKDESKAIDYFQRAAKHNHIKAIFNLIYCYTHGKGVKQNWFKVIEYYKTAANLGNIAAMQWLEYAYGNKFCNDFPSKQILINQLNGIG
ncbi:MAG: sel1 repeat family protein [Selenomonadaceae bacterium]|nr:sel1 repeat family protein [Selenomonadaceae bacterium]